MALKIEQQPGRQEGALSILHTYYDIKTGEAQDRWQDAGSFQIKKHPIPGYRYPTD